MSELSDQVASVEQSISSEARKWPCSSEFFRHPRNSLLCSHEQASGQGSEPGVFSKHSRALFI
jgi:hypothetical protein